MTISLHFRVTIASPTSPTVLARFVNAHGRILRMEDGMTEDIRLRKALHADKPFLFELRKATMSEHLLRAGLSSDDETHWHRVDEAFPDAHIICRSGAPIGVVALSKDEGSWLLRQIQLLPAWQNKGIGRSIISSILDDARRAGAPVSLFVLQGNPAWRLYESLGFRSIEETPAIGTLQWCPAQPPSASAA
jgi:N-acetylglutamate synthase-like GNAT family acetyltransferase